MRALISSTSFRSGSFLMAAKATAGYSHVPRRKLALTIGIGEYEDKNQNLPNAVNDAKDISSSLKRIGFIIDNPKLNLMYKDMRLELVNFECSIQEGDMVLFYFAGHGIQWEDQNYLIAADNLGISGTALAQRAINAQDILNRIADRKPSVTIFILDCCRKYHLRNQDLEMRHRSTMISQPQGLKQMSGRDGSLIVFACAAGAIAQDKGEKDDKNGLFTKHLLKNIETPNEHVIMMLFDVIKAVTEESESKQIPYFTGSLTSRNICLYEQPSSK